MAALFANSEQGAWYDPSDFSTMFQDSVGTTPVTAVEQPVGLILDKSKGLVLGSELVTNGTFTTDTTGWTASASAISIDTNRLKIVASTAYGWAYQGFTTVVGKSYEINYSVTNGDATTCYLWADTGVGLSAANFDSGALSDGDHTGIFVATATTTYIKPLIAGNGKFAFYDNISVKELAGNHASQATSTSRPVLKVDGAGKYYLLFDGVDDSLATAAIDFTATDKMTVWAGIRKLSDGGAGDLIGYVGVNFPYIGVPGNPPASYLFTYGSGGSIMQYALTTNAQYAAPKTVVLTGIGDISGDIVKLRLNGTEVSSITGDQGSGNYGSAVMHIGRRGGTTLPFNGNLYSLIIRGAASTAAQITSGEQYAASKTGVVL